MEHSNWICPYCSQQNDDSIQSCSNCSAPRAENLARYHDVQVLENLLELREKKEAAIRTREARIKDLARYTIIVLLIAWIPMLFIGIAIANGLSRIIVKEVPLQSAVWETNIHVETLKTFRDSGWTLPENARLIRTALENDPYPDDYAASKKTKYYYEYDAWTVNRTVRKTGKNNTPPTYGELKLKDNEREGSRSISYYLIFDYKDKREKIPCTEAAYYECVKTGVVRFHYVSSNTPSPFIFVLNES